MIHILQSLAILSADFYHAYGASLSKCAMHLIPFHSASQLRLPMSQHHMIGPFPYLPFISSFCNLLLPIPFNNHHLSTFKYKSPARTHIINLMDDHEYTNKSNAANARMQRKESVSCSKNGILNLTSKYSQVYTLLNIISIITKQNQLTLSAEKELRCKPKLN